MKDYNNFLVMLYVTNENLNNPPVTLKCLIDMVLALLSPFFQMAGFFWPCILAGILLGIPGQFDNKHISIQALRYSDYYHKFIYYDLN